MKTYNETMTYLNEVTETGRTIGSDYVYQAADNFHRLCTKISKSIKSFCELEKFDINAMTDYMFEHTPEEYRNVAW